MGRVVGNMAPHGCTGGARFDDLFVCGRKCCFVGNAEGKVAAAIRCPGRKNRLSFVFSALQLV